MTSINLAMNGGSLTWGEILARERKAHMPPYTQAELAKRCGVDLRAVEAWERNERAPSGSALGRLYGAIASMRYHSLLLFDLRRKLGEALPDPKTPEPPPTATPTPRAAGTVAADAGPAPPRAAWQADARAAPAAPRPKTEPPPPAAAPAQAYAFASFGQALAHMRLKNDLHQVELATLVGGDCTQYEISRWERDETQPSPDQLAKLRGLFDGLDRAPPPTGRIKSTYRRRPTTGRIDVDISAPLPPPPAPPAPPVEPPPAPTPVLESKEPAMPVHAVKNTAAVAPQAPAAPSPQTAAASPLRRFLAAARTVRHDGHAASLAALMRSKEWGHVLDVLHSKQWHEIAELVRLADELGMPLTELADEIDR